MGREAARLAALALVLLFGVFYGITVTRDGIGHVYGPLEERGAAEETRAGGPEAMLSPDAALEGAAPAFRAERPGEPSALSRFARAAGDLLRLLADGLVRLFVRLGEAVLS